MVHTPTRSDSEHPLHTVVLTAGEVERCHRFAAEAARTNSQDVHRLGNVAARPVEEFLADQIQGKLAEIAVARAFAAFGVRVSLDFRHYPDPRRGDDGDIPSVVLNGHRCPVDLRCDVKSGLAEAQGYRI